MLFKKLKLSEVVFRAAYSKVTIESEVSKVLSIVRSPKLWVEDLGAIDVTQAEECQDIFELDKARVMHNIASRDFQELYGTQDVIVAIRKKDAQGLEGLGPHQLSDEALFTLASNAKQNIVVIFAETEEVMIVRLFMGDGYKCVMICKDDELDGTVIGDSDVDEEIGSFKGFKAFGYLPDWDKLRWLTLGESLSDGDMDEKMVLEYPTITNYCYATFGIFQWNYHIQMERQKVDESTVTYYTKEGRVYKVDKREDVMLPYRIFCDMTNDVERYKNYLDDKRAERMNAVCIPRPKPDIWTTNQTIEQYLNREVVLRNANEPPRKFTVHQFHPYANGGYDIANNIIGASIIDKALFETLNWKVFAKSIRYSSMIVRVGILSLKAAWPTEDGMHENKYSDVALDVCIALDKHYRPAYVIVQLKPIEKFNPTMACTDVYTYNEQGLSGNLIESIGLRIRPMGLIEYYKELGVYGIIKYENSDLEQWILTTIKDKMIEIRSVAATVLRKEFEQKPNSRMVKNMSDDALLGQYHIVPAAIIASKLKYVSCAVITKKELSHIQPSQLIGTYINRKKCLFGITSSMRDSLAMKLLVKNRNSNSERNATESDALKWCSSYTIDCKAIGELRMLDEGTVQLPCGFRTNDYNSMMNKHACVRSLMSVEAKVSENVHIHGAYRCTLCNRIYQSNISALICNYRCKC